MKKKIGIISELNLNNCNYGNRLQSYALNYYINKTYDRKYRAESILLKYYDEKIVTKKHVLGIIRKVLSKAKTHLVRTKPDEYFLNRLENCNKFTITNLILSQEEYTKKKLSKSEYSKYIVGSDVVWAQFNNGINSIRFLDFGINKAKRISYAASFGRDWIPEENKKIIRDKLSKFSYISVREKSSIKLLNEIGVDNVEHVCDPTLLLEKDEWNKLAKKVEGITQKFIFVYLLGKDVKQRENIKALAKEKKLKIVNIPHANGVIDSVDDNFGDIKVHDCSPENWIWLIENSEYFITDSFHGAVFGSIFEKKFIVIRRNEKADINNRMIDYLNTIDAEELFVELNDKKNINDLNWNYNKINSNIEAIKKISKNFLDKALNEED